MNAEEAHEEKRELEAYFRAQTNIRLASLEDELKEMRIDMNKGFNKLYGMRAFLIGGAAAVSAIVSTLTAMLYAVLR